MISLHRRCFIFAALLMTTALCAQVQSTGELRAERALEAAKKAGAPELYAFLKPMPKGADLHMHLSGAVYAETFIAEAIKAGLCVAPVDVGAPAVPTGKNALRFVARSPKGCTEGQIPAASALERQPLYDSLIDSFSMRAFVPTQGVNGHDQFFSTFDRFGGLHDFRGDWLDEVAARAATQNEQYLEIMHTPPFGNAARIATRIGWPAGSEKSVSPSVLASLRDALLAAGLRDEIVDDKKNIDVMEAQRERIEHCASAVEPLSASDPCSVKIRYLFQVLRGFPPQQVFAQTLLGFEVASVDPRFVGLNFVMPEDGRVSMQDYHLQMQMLDYLHSVYPKVHISLHAGEIAPGLVSPDGLRFHIREAIDLGHAERIGHGVDVLYEERPAELLKQMAIEHIALEVNLTSNDVILGIKGKDHPLAAYRAAHVPFALSTDDEGVSRIDLTHEYVRAVMEQNFNYAELKGSARASLEHSFLPGEDLWTKTDSFVSKKGSCPAVITEHTKPRGNCEAFLKGNLRAAEQFELERRFASFEIFAPALSGR